MGDLPKVDEETEGKIVKWFRRQMWPARAFISQGRASFNDNIRFTDGRRIDDGVYLSRACKYGDFILFKKKEKGKHYCVTHVRSRGGLCRGQPNNDLFFPRLSHFCLSSVKMTAARDPRQVGGGGRGERVEIW